MSEFDSAWRKWSWAGRHARELKKCFPPRGATPPFLDASVKSEYDPKRHCVILRMATSGPIPPEWSLRLGDVVANYRAALDHLAWAVVMRGSRTGPLTPTQERRVYFPITTSDSDFTKRVRADLQGARRADLAIIRRYQPYKRGKRNLRIHVLMVLNECSNLDKHRTLQPTAAHPARSVLTINHVEDCVVTRFGPSLVRTTAIQPGAEIGRVYVRKTGPYPRAYMNGVFGLDVSIGEHVWLRPWLTETESLIGCMLAEFSDPPVGVLYVPPDAV